MPILETQLNSRSADFLSNSQAMQVLVADLQQKIQKIQQGGGDAARAKHTVNITIHGLRRTYSNIADELKIPSEAQHYLQGHAPQGVRQQNYKSWDIEVLRPYQNQMESFLLSKCPSGLL